MGYGFNVELWTSLRLPAVEEEQVFIAEKIIRVEVPKAISFGKMVHWFRVQS